MGVSAAVILVSLIWHGAPAEVLDQSLEDSNFERILRGVEVKHTGDLEAIKREGVIRVLTRNNSSHYFVFKGAQWGFQYEMAKRFADSLGVRLEMVVPPDRDSLIDALLEGEGDVIAAGMTITPKRAERVRFSVPVSKTRRVIVTNEDIVKPLTLPEHLSSFVVHLNFRSTTYAMAQAYQKRLGLPLLLMDVPPDIEMEEMLRRVGSGEYEATIVDDDLLKLEQAAGAPIEGRLRIGRSISKGWAFRPGATELAAAADAFITRSRKSGLKRILYNRYFDPVARGARRAQASEFRADASGQISPFDDLFRTYGKEVGIDWRLLAALAYTESRFDPSAKSNFGAVGLMQVLPQTAKELKALRLRGDLMKQLRKPDLSVRVSAHYLKWLMERFEQEGVSKKQQIRFALAAYNAGIGHVMDARDLAQQTGKDPNRWFKNVEDAFLLKKDRKWHRKTRYGFCRADQVIAYVSSIQTRYDVYTRYVPFE